MRGHIRKRGKRWALVIPLGRDPVTKRARQKWLSFRTRAEAEATLTEIRAAMQGGGWTPPEKILTGDFLDLWLAKTGGKVGPVTRRNRADAVRVHLKPALGHVLLPALSVQAVEDYANAKIAAGVARSSVQKHLGLLRQALSAAVRWGKLNRNVAALAETPRGAPRDVRVWDEEQTRLFLAAAKRSRYPALFLTAVLCGLRSGELAGLRWQDVDLTVGTAHVRQTVYRLGKQLLVKPPKTESSRRIVSLPPGVVEALAQLRSDQEENRRLLGAEYQDHDLVFCQPNGKPLHMHNVTRRDFRESMKAAGVPRITFHTLRHVHASYLALAGVPARVAMERLGHSTPGFTLRVYSHVLPGQQEAAARAVEALVFGHTRR